MNLNCNILQTKQCNQSKINQIDCTISLRSKKQHCYRQKRKMVVLMSFALPVCGMATNNTL